MYNRNVRSLGRCPPSLWGYPPSFLNFKETRQFFLTVLTDYHTGRTPGVHYYRCPTAYIRQPRRKFLVAGEMSRLPRHAPTQNLAALPLLYCCCPLLVAHVLLPSFAQFHPLLVHNALYTRQHTPLASQAVHLRITRHTARGDLSQNQIHSLKPTVGTRHAPMPDAPVDNNLLSTTQTHVAVY